MEGASWAAAPALLHPIRAGSVEKGCGLKRVTSVPVSFAPKAFCREREWRRQPGNGEDPLRSSRWPAGCFAASQIVVVFTAGFSHLPQSYQRKPSPVKLGFYFFFCFLFWTVSGRVLINPLQPQTDEFEPARITYLEKRKWSSVCCVQVLFLSSLQRAGCCSERRI